MTFEELVNFTPIGGETITIADAVNKFSESEWNQDKRRPAVLAACTLETAAVRFWDNGKVPTAAVGHLWDVGRILFIYGTETIKLFRLIRNGGTSGVITITYYTHRSKP